MFTSSVCMKINHIALHIKSKQSKCKQRFQNFLRDQDDIAINNFVDVKTR